MNIWKKRLFALIIGTAVILFWRGIWGLADKLLFPNNYLLSSTVSVIAGLLILLATHHAIKELI